MHRIIGRIKVEDDFLRRGLVRLQEQIDQQPSDGDRIVTNLVIARRLEFAQHYEAGRPLTVGSTTSAPRCLASSCEDLQRHAKHQRDVLVGEFQQKLFHLLFLERDFCIPLHAAPNEQARH